MKLSRLSVPFLLFAAALTVGCQQRKPVGNNPALAVYDSMDKDIGEVAIGDKPITIEFQLTNEGDRSLHIRDVVTTCDCTDAKFSDESLFNGDKTIITVSLKTKAIAEGPFERMIGVYTSVRQRPDTLYFHGVAKHRK